MKTDRISPYGTPVSSYIRRGYRILRWTNPITGERESVCEHRLVYEETYGSIPSSHHIHHKDGDRLNNELENLELLTRSAHASTHAVRSLEGHRRRCMNKYDRDRRRQLRESGNTTALAEYLWKEHERTIRRGQCKGIRPYQPRPTVGHRQLNESQVREIFSRFQARKINSGMMQILARDYGISDSLVWAIVHGKAWKHLGLVSESEL